MSADTQALLRAALRLPVPQRAEFAAELLDSLDEGVAEDPEEGRVRWLTERTPEQASPTQGLEATMRIELMYTALQAVA